MIMNRLFRELTGMAINHNWIILLASSLLLTITNVNGIQLTEISVPEVADAKEGVNLTCTYHTGKHKLNSVKWYKDGAEFFRYAPLMTPAILTFPVAGISLLTEQTYICNSRTCTISLEQLEANTTGSYRCEVSGDAPEFKLDSQTANMTIGVLPRHDPLITGLAEHYEDGALVSVNCSTDTSSPPASITWYLDGKRVPNDFNSLYHEETVQSNNGFHLQARIRELHFKLDRHQLLDEDRHSLELRCSAQLDGLPSIHSRDTVKFVSLRQAEISNPLMKYLAEGSSGVAVRIHSLVLLQFVLLSVVIVPLLFTAFPNTQLS